MPSYDDMCRTILQFYQTPEQLSVYGGWENLFDPNNAYTVEQVYNSIRNNPGIKIIERQDGTIVGWYSKSTGSGNIVSDIGSIANSNTVGGTNSSGALTNIQTRPDIALNDTGGVVVKNASKIKNIRWEGAAGVGAAVTAVATGLSLGVAIDKAIYELKPFIFSDEELENFNPENWKQISSVVDEQWTEMGYPTVGKIGRKVFDTILGIDSTDNSTQMYIDEDVYAYMAWYLQNNGVFDITQKIDISSVPESKLRYPGNYKSVYPMKHMYSSAKEPNGSYYKTVSAKVISGDAYILVTQDEQYVHLERPAQGFSVYSKTPFVVEGGIKEGYNRPPAPSTSTMSGRRVSNALTGETYYYANAYSASSTTKALVRDFTESTYLGETTNDDWATLVLDGTMITSGVDGISAQPGAKIPDLSTATDLDSFKTLLKQQYPDVWTNSVTKQVLQPDGTLKTFTYVPVPTPNATDWMDTEPTGDGSQQNQNDTVVNPDMDSTIKDVISSSGSTGYDTPNPPDTGDGNSPVIIPPVGKASSLWSIYNPTLEQVNQFGSWLWSSNFVEQLKKLFSDPMQAIIGLHKVYSPVQTSGQGTIKCGYLDSGVPSKLVSEQYVTVDCGSVDMQEYFGNVFDYPPYTDISIYLPFIGVRPLDPSDVVRSTISVIYHIDVLTGACLAEVNVKRDAAGGILYTFSGDAAVRYPVSSGSYMGIVSGLIGVATSVVSGNILPAIGGVTRLHTNVDRSGSFTGNSGAMGSKVPYIIISRPQTAMADNFETLSGYPSNTYTQLSACKGFTQVSYCHVENMSATETEKNEIERLLKEGVIF